MRSETYLRAGGMDESFIGWGGEDDALSAALERSGAACRILSARPAFHLWHPREESDCYGHPAYAANHARVIWWRTAPRPTVEAAMAEGPLSTAQSTSEGWGFVGG